MSDQKIEGLSPEAFPFPKIVQAFNYFFPKEKGAPDIFTIENLRRFSRVAPYLALAILGVIFASWIRGCIYAHKHQLGEIVPSKHAIYVFFDTAGFIIAFSQYLWWLGASLFAKLLRRSPMIPLVMSFIDPLRMLGGLCILHFIGFIIGALADAS